VKTTLGMNEALILACLSGCQDSTVAALAAQLEADDRGRKVDDGSIYMALQRMGQRGFVTMRKERVTSADGRPRDIGVYRITGAGSGALDQFLAETDSVGRLRLAMGAR
jgi:DNA-binding PadR family transcriptional regulator